MSLKFLYLFLLSTLSISLFAEDVTESAPRAWHFSAEAAPVWQTSNNFRIPSVTGTTVKLAESNHGPFLSYRFYLGYRWGEQLRHEVRGLWAPLSLSVSANSATPIDFENQTFAAATPLEATYQFHSYRLTYRYLFFQGESWNWSVGITGKIRDAKIRLSQGTTAAERKDVGFVPLVHVHGEWQWTENWKLLLDIDALAAPQGRAEDILIALQWSPLQQWSFFSGYRLLEGGADNRDIFTSACLHYLTFGARYSF